ncbi:NUDIX domain-containing protein [Methylobacterium brachythecii]|uniref:8-oxo-dGTP pyrophosphatase MutT (NUDIX family) n=1 Tax=Methylobacterium brachythecii TaxID=1176177 RepID=A0A7W6F6B0_9HYPH|nr:NUDIX domain-containing protein [Methylobacterium brachythecii]MBB3901806.1 8-oxo-dGTP pyrophosphatase MutT (NUDIX family) [Methylobacterium brachythecii]GLS43184.1 NUDIX hydrolase [Methylobacterium brachythecii]
MALNLDLPVLRRLAHGAAMLTRGMTLGVRGIAIDGENRVCLVRHTYVRGWYLPGGGIEPGETAAASMAREFREEAELIVDPAVPLRLHGFLFNSRQWGRDHIALFVAPAFTLARAKAPDREIAECGFFPLDALPADTTRGTRARLDEFREGRAPGEHW